MARGAFVACCVAGGLLCGDTLSSLPQHSVHSTQHLGGVEGEEVEVAADADAGHCVQKQNLESDAACNKRFLALIQI